MEYVIPDLKEPQGYSAAQIPLRIQYHIEDLTRCQTQRSHRSPFCLFNLQLTVNEKKKSKHSGGFKKDLLFSLALIFPMSPATSLQL